MTEERNKRRTLGNRKLGLEYHISIENMKMFLIPDLRNNIEFDVGREAFGNSHFLSANFVLSVKKGP